MIGVMTEQPCTSLRERKKRATREALHGWRCGWSLSAGPMR